MLGAMAMGIVDALAPNDTVKAFGWLFILGLTFLVVSYELIYYREPIHPVFISGLLTGVFIGSLWGIWNITWYVFRLLAQLPITDNGRIGIAPGISLSPQIWWLTTIWALLVVFICHISIVEFGAQVRSLAENRKTSI
jgi:hypothetical protein